MYTVEVIRFQSVATRSIKRYNDKTQATTAAKNAVFSLGFERLSGRKRATVRIMHNGKTVKQWRLTA